MSSDLFDFSEKNSNRSENSPLAHRMRPLDLHEFVGQEKILGPGKPLRLWIESDRVPSLILWGPPGCGKTSLAQMIARQTRSEFESLSAVLSGVKELRDAVNRAKESRRLYHRKTFLFIDEIHRFNRTQQDALLPHVEDGTVTLIGATTENPSFEVNSALLSRTRVIRLEKLSLIALKQTLQRALSDPTRGLGGFFQLSSAAVEWIAAFSEGDARRALTALETVSLAIGTQAPETEKVAGKVLDVSEVQAALESALPRQPIPYDKKGEEHYNVISAFIKSLRDSDPHASLYYLARMLEGGEDPLFIVRRLVILASEDIGNADPRALMIAVAAKEAVEFVGMPEARINLAQAVTYLALAPKSNASYSGIEEALEDVRKTGALSVPFHLRNGTTRLMRSEGYGEGYRYAHSEPEGRAKQAHLPTELLKKRYYQPKDSGFEKQLKAKLDFLNPDFDGSASPGTSPSSAGTSPIDSSSREGYKGSAHEDRE